MKDIFGNIRASIKYSNFFYFVVIVIIASTVAIYYLNTKQGMDFTTVSAKNETASAIVSQFINSTEYAVKAHSKMLLEQSSDTNFINSSSVSNVDFVNTREGLAGYIFIEKLDELAISELYDRSNGLVNDLSILHAGMYSDGSYDFINSVRQSGGSLWTMLYNSSDKKNYYALIYKLSETGVFGVTVSCDYLNEIVNKNSNSDSFNFMLEDDGKIIFHNTYKSGEYYQSKDDTLYEQISGDNGSFIIKQSDIDFKYSFEKLENGSYLISTENSEISIRSSNFSIIMITIISLIFLFMNQINIVSNKSLYSIITNRVHKYFYFQEQIEKKYKANAIVGFQIAAILLAFIYFIFEAISGNFWYKGVMYLILATVLIGAFFVKSTGGNKSITTILCVTIMTIPSCVFLADLLTGAQANYSVLTWTVFAVFPLLFSDDREYSRKLLSILTLMMYALMLSSIALISFVDDVHSVDFRFIGSIMFVILMAYITIELFTSQAKENYSELDKIYRQLRETQSMLVQNEKLSTLGHLIAGVAHEINTPIGAIKASSEILDENISSSIKMIMETTKDFTQQEIDVFAELMTLTADSLAEMRSTQEIRRSKPLVRAFLKSMDVDNSEEIADFLFRLEICDIEKLEKNIDLFKMPTTKELLKVLVYLSPILNATQSVLFATTRVSKIVFALKSYAHMNISGEFANYDVVSNIETVLVLYHNQLKHGIEIIKEFEDDIPELMGNSDEMSQVWTNIIQNAIYAMSNVGTLVIGVKCVDRKYVEVTFTDSGAGIPSDDLKKIFSAFYTTKPMGEGTGLGLDICKKVIDKHNGSISVESTVGVGTTFRIRLPILA